MTPDLIMQVTCTLPRARVKELAAESERRGDIFEISPQRMRPWGSRWRLHMIEGHDLLSDDADWDAPTWAMDPIGLERLAATLAWLYDNVPGELTFEAVWGSIEDEVPVSRAGLLAIVRAGEIGNGTVYRVAARD